MNDTFVLLQTHGGDKLLISDTKGPPERWYFSLKPDVHPLNHREQNDGCSFELSKSSKNEM